MCRDAWPRVLLLSGALFLCVGAWPLVSEEEQLLDKEELKAELDNIKQRLLANLGLSRIPDVSHTNVSAAEMARMMAIYQRSVAESMEDEDEDEDEEDDNVIHRFYSYRDNAPVNKTPNWQHLYFPLTISNGQDETHRQFSIHSAKLRLHRLCKGRRATASIYQLLEPWDGTESTDRILVEEMKLGLPKSSKPRKKSCRDKVTVVDLSKPVTNWVENPALNYGLLLQCSSALRSRHYQLTSPRAVLDILVKERPTRQKRSKSFPFRDSIGQNLRKDCTSSNKTNLCCRYSLTVSFKEIDWDFVVGPAEFQANFCRGKCIKGMSSYNSNHAHIQSIVNYKGKNVPRPCCAPKKLGHLDIMHYNDKSPKEIVITRLKGMIVKSCGCS